LANRGEITLAHVDNILTFNPDFARVRPHQTDEMLEQNAFAAAACAHNGERLAPSDVEIDTAQNSCAPIVFTSPWRQSSTRSVDLARSLIAGGVVAALSSPAEVFGLNF